MKMRNFLIKKIGMDQQSIFFKIFHFALFVTLLFSSCSVVEGIESSVVVTESEIDLPPEFVRNTRESGGRPIWPGGDDKPPPPPSRSSSQQQQQKIDHKFSVVQKQQSQQSQVKLTREQNSGKKDSRTGYTWGDYTTQTQTQGPWTQGPWTQQPSNNCTCVPYYYCPDESQVVSDGSGYRLDIRHGWRCNSVLEVCCRRPRPTPPPTVTPPPHWTTTTPSHHHHSSTAIPGFTPRCGTINPNGVNARILGFKDSETQFGEYPFMAGILEKKQIQGRWANYFLCGASLVWPSVAVTAAHCVRGKKPGSLVIRLGEWDTQSSNEFYPYQDIWGYEIVVHPDYYPGALYNDIALVFFQRPAVLAPHIDTVCLPPLDTSSQAYDSNACYATGWGKNAFGQNGSYQAILKEVELPIIPKGVCQDALRRTNLGPNFNLDDSFLCAGGLKGQDTCVGDGGGPLVCPSLIDPWRFILVGIVSWGVHCGDYGVPGVYVDVARFRQWIDQTIGTRVPHYDTSRVTVNNQYG